MSLKTKEGDICDIQTLKRKLLLLAPAGTKRGKRMRERKTDTDGAFING